VRPIFLLQKFDRKGKKFYVIRSKQHEPNNSEEEDPVPKLVVATSTRYRTEEDVQVRGRLAWRTFNACEKHRYPVVCADDISNPTFLNSLEGLRNLTIVNGRGRTMREARQFAIREALLSAPGVPLVWTEPEKHTLIPFLSELSRPIRVGEADLVLPARRSMNSLPREQAYLEACGNSLLSIYCGIEADWHFGPRVMNARAAQYLLSYDEEGRDHWEIIFVPIFRMIKDGLRVISIPVSYEHPPEQKREEEGNPDFVYRRIVQLKTLVEVMHREAMLLGLYAREGRFGLP